MKRHEPNPAASSGKVGRIALRGAIGLVALGALGLLAPACLDRPVAPQQPSTSRLSTRLYKNQRVDKIDLLFMIDNSASMADKQAILAEAVPDLVARLVNPVCVDRETREVAAQQPLNPTDDCLNPGSQEREFDPINDIHIGVITSSIGGHGADSCSEGTQFNPRQADMSHLITKALDGSDVPTFNNAGFLNWDPDGKYGAATDLDTLQQNFKRIVTGTGQVGCGFEASLEAWYRFLVDPAPYEKMGPVPCNADDPGTSCRGGQGIDATVLSQREAFLRQDSLLAIIMLSDENDCSIIDGGQNYLALQSKDGDKPFHVNRGTDACKTDPWSPDCHSCWVNPGDHPECAAGWGDVQLDEPLNLRCFEQKRRFGMSFLQPIRRYVDGLTQVKFADGTVNPVFCTRFATAPDPNDPNATIIDRTQCLEVLRDPSLIFLGGIVGVPWQDLARNPTNLAQGYRPVEELAWTPERFSAEGQEPPNGLESGSTLWKMILGETDDRQTLDTNGDGVAEVNPYYREIIPTVAPLDPLMIESVDPRQGTHPITGVPLVQPGSGDPVGHPVNSSEWTITARADLQYACTFPLPDAIDCSDPANAFGCDCNNGPENPLCWSGSAYSPMQQRAKAYPGRRQLAVLKGMASQAIVASVCPANMTNPDEDDYGYRPAIGAIVDRLKSALQGTCWDQALEPDPDGLEKCIVLEATKGSLDADGNPVCGGCTGVRSEPSEQAKSALATDKVFIENGLNCVCEIQQAEPGGEMETCRQQAVTGQADGWCYVDPTKGGNPELVATCPPNQKRLIRFVGEQVPAPGSLTFLQCRGASIGGSSSTGAAGSGG